MRHNNNNNNNNNDVINLITKISKKNIKTPYFLRPSPV